MPSPLRLALATTALTLTFSVNPVAARAQQRPVTADQTKIIDTVSTIFTAARADDVAKFDSVIASDFYIYDVGRPIQRRLRHGWHQGATCRGHALRMECDRA